MGAPPPVGAALLSPHAPKAMVHASARRVCLRWWACVMSLSEGVRVRCMEGPSIRRGIVRWAKMRPSPGEKWCRKKVWHYTYIHECIMRGCSGFVVCSKCGKGVIDGA